MASVIPKSRKTALAIILAPIVLGMEPTAVRPSSVCALYLRASSDFRTLTTAGSVDSQTPLLFSSTTDPSEPSLKERDTGAIASSVKLAQPVKRIVASASVIAVVIFIFIVVKVFGVTSVVEWLVWSQLFGVGCYG
jgi:hypothetical protein